LPGVKLRVELPSAAPVRLQVYDVMGRRRRTLLDGALPAGATAVAWDGRDGNGAMAGSGVYFVRLSCGRAQRVVKVPLLR
jgi:flagellar hook assembly protein FlgD